MAVITTPKGTKLPLLEIEGGLYLEAKWRLAWFREENEENKIETIINSDENRTIAKAIVYAADGNIWATAHKSCLSTKYADHLEAAETGAIARALALCGYGTQFGNELKEAGISDGPVKHQSIPQEINLLSVIGEIEKILASKPEEAQQKAIQKIFNKKQMGRIKNLDPEELQSGLEIMKTSDFWTHLANS